MSAGYGNTSGSGNTFSGFAAGNQSDSGNNNIFIGYEAGYYMHNGNNDIFVGVRAGYDNTIGGSNDIYIGNQGTPLGTEDNTIRIGTQGTGQGEQDAAYIAGIYGKTTSGGIPIYINSNGQLGTASSSLRFKEQVRDMGNRTNELMKLRPVTFLYKPEYANGENTLQYGLIAEEVAKVYPELVAYDNEGQPYTVRYQYLASMLLNEVQKQYRRAKKQNEVIEAQQQEIEGLKLQLQLQNTTLQQRLTRLETLIAQPVAARAQN